MAADFENAAGLGTKHPVPDDCTTSRRSAFGPTESRENDEREGLFSNILGPKFESWEQCKQFVALPVLAN